MFPQEKRGGKVRVGGGETGKRGVGLMGSGNGGSARKKKAGVFLSRLTVGGWWGGV